MAEHNNQTKNNPEWVDKILELNKEKAKPSHITNEQADNN